MIEHNQGFLRKEEKGTILTKRYEIFRSKVARKRLNYSLPQELPTAWNQEQYDNFRTNSEMINRFVRDLSETREEDNERTSRH